MDIDKLTGTEQLREDQRELADVIGLEAYKKLNPPLWRQSAVHSAGRFSSERPEG